MNFLYDQVLKLTLIRIKDNENLFYNQKILFETPRRVS